MRCVTAVSQIVILICIASCSILLFPDNASAHGGNGFTFTSTTTDGYIVDVDYDQPAFYPESEGRFTFELFTDGTRVKTIPYTDLWVRIVKDTDVGWAIRGDTIFAGPINKTDIGGAGFLFSFATPGKYTLHVRYNDSTKDGVDETLAEAAFPLEVIPAYRQRSLEFSPGFWLGLVIGAILTIAFISVARRFIRV